MRFWGKENKTSGPEDSTNIRKLNLRATNKTDKKIEKDLDNLLYRLNKIQEALGMDPATSKSGSEEQKHANRFHEVREQIILRLNKVRDLQMESKDGALASRAEARIRNHQFVRENIGLAEQELVTLNNIYQKEARKKLSKLPKEQLEGMLQMVRALRLDLNQLKDSHKNQFAPLDVGEGRATDIGGFGVNLMDYKSLDMESGPNVGRYRSGQDSKDPHLYQEEKMTYEQQLRLDQLKKRDHDQDLEYLTRIERGVEQAQEIALVANEELQRQEVIIDNLDLKMEKAIEHATHVNLKLKEVLKKVREADKLCLDIICIVILLGLAGLLYQMTKDTSMASTVTSAVKSGG